MATITFTRTSNVATNFPRPQFLRGGAEITKSDADVFAEPVNVYVGTAGTVEAVPEWSGPAGDPVTVECVSGGFVPFRCWAVKSTGTDAADLVAVFD